FDFTSLPVSVRSGSGKNGMLGSDSKSGGNVPVFCSHVSHGSLLGKTRSISAKTSFCLALSWAKVAAPNDHGAKDKIINVRIWCFLIIACNSSQKPTKRSPFDFSSNSRRLNVNIRGGCLRNEEMQHIC